jgi:hypothetical protein
LSFGARVQAFAVRYKAATRMSARSCTDEGQCSMATGGNSQHSALFKTGRSMINFPVA